MFGLGPEVLVILVIVVLLFGANRLPKLARSMREARSEFEKGKDGDETPAGDGRNGTAAGDGRKDTPAT